MSQTDPDRFVTSFDVLAKGLLEAGIVSKRCKKFTFSMEAGGVAKITQEVFVTAAQFEKIAELMKQNAAGIRQHTIAVNELDHSKILDMTEIGEAFQGAADATPDNKE